MRTDLGLLLVLRLELGLLLVFLLDGRNALDGLIELGDTGQTGGVQARLELECPLVARGLDGRHHFIHGCPRIDARL